MLKDTRRRDQKLKGTVLETQYARGRSPLSLLMDPLRLPRARVASKAECAVSAAGTGQKTRLPRLSDAARSREEGVAAAVPLGKHDRCSNNDALRYSTLPPHEVGRRVVARAKEERKPAANKSRRSASSLERVGQLSALDERVLILYHSTLKYGRSSDRQANEHAASGSAPKIYGPEATYAAVKIQKVARGLLTRRQLAEFHGPKNQHAASIIQFAYRRALTRRRIAHRIWEKQQRLATRIQAWYRGCRGRDLALAHLANRLNSRIANFQRRFRGLRFWRVVAALLHKRKADAAREVQRVYRGWRGRCRATIMRFEKIRFAQDLMSNAELHARFARCEGCRLEQCTEDSLLRCLMARYLGLHDLVGAKALGEQGVQKFPSSAVLCFLYACLLQSTCDDLEVCMAYLNRATADGVQQHELDQVSTSTLCSPRQFASTDRVVWLCHTPAVRTSVLPGRAHAPSQRRCPAPTPGHLLPKQRQEQSRRGSL